MATEHLDPYAPIEKRPLQVSDGMQSSAFSVRIEDHEEETGWNEVGVVSKDYLLVENARVRDLAFEVAGRSQLGFRQEKTFFDGKRFMLALTARREDALIDVCEGDPVGIGLMFRNSYDGSTRLSARLFVHRLACKNGMIVPSLFHQVRFKHDFSGHGWETETERALSMLQSSRAGLQEFAEAAQALASTRVSASRLREIRGEVLPQLPLTTWGKTIDRFLLEEQLDGFGLLNAGTNVLWHEDNPTASTFKWNRYFTSGLVEHALGRELHARCN